MNKSRSKMVIVLFLVSAAIVLTLSLYSGAILNSLTDSLENSRSERLLAEAFSASLMVSGEELEAITNETSLANDSAVTLQRRLAAFVALHGISDIAYFRLLPSGEMQHLVFSSSSASSGSAPSSPQPLDERVAEAFKGGLVVSNLEDINTGTLELVAFSPVYNTKGEVVAVAAVGIDDEVVLGANTKIQSLTVILIVCIAIVLLAACANVLMQIRKENELEKSVATQRLMITISQTLTSDQLFNLRIQEALALLGRHCGATRAYLVDLAENDAEHALRQHWSLDGSAPDSNKAHAQAVWQTMFTAFQNAEVGSPALYCPSLKDDNSNRYQGLAQTPIKAFIWVPLVVQNEQWGVLALDFCEETRPFLDNDRQLIESATSDLVGAITREHYSEERELALDHAVQANEAKSEFLSNMSHEMRTPMNAIMGMTSIALGTEDNSRKDYCLGHIKEASTHLLSIINDVLDMSNVQEGKLTLTLAPFALREALDEAIESHLYAIHGRHQNFSFEVDKHIPPQLLGDKRRLAQIISNLLSNATKFTPEGGTIRLDAFWLGESAQGHKLRIEVTDTGIGVDPSIRNSLFASFEQAEHGTMRKYGGLGLGLAISKRCVELMDGTMGVTSEQGEGSQFYFTVTLPAAAPVDPPQKVSVEDDRRSGDHDRRKSDEPGLLPAEFDRRKGSLDRRQGPQGSAALGAQSAGAGPQGAALPLETGVSCPIHKNTDTPDLSDYRLLLAEDIDINQELVLALLENSCVQVDVVGNGLEALKAVEDNPGCYDLIFMDLQMPEMDGLEATRRIRALDAPELAKLPIVAMTANVFQEDIDACLAAGMNDHIGKPVSVNEIFRILNKYLPAKAGT